MWAYWEIPGDIGGNIRIGRGETIVLCPSCVTQRGATESARPPGLGEGVIHNQCKDGISRGQPGHSP